DERKIQKETSSNDKLRKKKIEKKIKSKSLEDALALVNHTIINKSWQMISSLERS
ncbi:Hypothetical protein FKW44_002941, partial [Caligus rogercresseyi]